jgi:hypothetical protein
MSRFEIDADLYGKGQLEHNWDMAIERRSLPAGFNGFKRPAFLNNTKSTYTRISLQLNAQSEFREKTCPFHHFSANFTLRIFDFATTVKICLIDPPKRQESSTIEKTFIQRSK